MLPDELQRRMRECMEMYAHNRKKIVELSITVGKEGEVERLLRHNRDLEKTVAQCREQLNVWALIRP